MELQKEGPKAPKDPTKKRKSFFIMRGKQVAGSPQQDGRGIQYIYENDGRLISSAKLVGNIADEEILGLLKTTEGFRKLVHSIGVTVEAEDRNQIVTFAFQMYGKTDTYGSGTTLRMPVKTDGMEYILNLEEQHWFEDDLEPGQIRFEFESAGELAKVAVRFYLQDGFDAPEPAPEKDVDFTSPEYKQMQKNAVMQLGNTYRLRKAMERGAAGEDITIAFIGGSITQGAGATPINKECYAYKTFAGLCKLLGKGVNENIHYIKAGVGGTPSELGMIRYERDVLRDGSVIPDIVVVEYAVNDEGDETKGHCYESLVRKIYDSKNKPAVILEFAVFADDFNLQERLSPIGKAYRLPMVSTKNMVIEQFYKKPEEGRVVSKNQFFYDSYHPTNIGHTMMADGILQLFRQVQALEEITDKALGERPVLSDAFWKVQLLDRQKNDCGAVISPGDFVETDEDLQAVEMDMDLTTTKEFPYNWMYRGSRNDGPDYLPFAMDIECSSLFLVSKDSASNQVGKAEVYVDGEKCLVADPKINGWTHCNAQIVFREREKRIYHVEVRMQPGDEKKDFTILGWGYIERGF